ncbi:MAG: protein kinase domain-containing protein [Aggregatilineales bacterium]
MPVILEKTEATRHLTDHERTALATIRATLAKEEGYLIPGKFEPAYKDMALKVKEIDALLVLPGMVLLLELKGRSASRIVLDGLDKPMQVWRGSIQQTEENPLSGLWYACQALRSRIADGGVQAHVYPLLIAYSMQPNSPFDVSAGSAGIKGGAAACKPDEIAEMLTTIRHELNISVKYPLDQARRVQLEKLKQVVHGTVRALSDTVKQQVGPAIFERRRAFSEDGGDFTLYEGVEEATEQPLWVKQYRRDLLATRPKADKDKLFVLRDAVALAKFTHPNIARYKTTINADDFVYVILEREPGQFLRERMKSRDLAPPAKLTILGDLLDGLAHIHSLGALYRDLRPETVFVTTDGHAQLFNFECTRLPTKGTVFEHAQQRAQKWRNYASYELLTATAASQIGPATDVFSWGVVAYELLTGKLPYTDENKLANGKFVSLANFTLSISDELQMAIEQALSPVEDERPQLSDLRAAITAEISG